MTTTTVTPNEAVLAAVRTIIDELNSSNRKGVIAAIHQAVSQSHRTLQQGFWDAVLAAQVTYADNAHDLRNEAAVKLAGLVRDAAKTANFDLGLPRY